MDKASSRTSLRLFESRSSLASTQGDLNSCLSHQRSSLAGGPVLIGGTEKPEPVAKHFGTTGAVRGGLIRHVKARGSSKLRPCALLLPHTKLFASPDGRGGVGMYIGAGDKGVGLYVPATHVRASLCDRKLLHVTVDAHSVPVGHTLQAMQERSSMTHEQAAAAKKAGHGEWRTAKEPLRAQLSPTLWTARLALAWGYNLLFALAAVATGIALTLGIHEGPSHRERLQASNLSPVQWWRLVAFGFAWTLFQSLVIVDGVKCLMLTLSSPNFVHRLPEGSLKRLMATQLLRNAHKLFDAIL